VIDANDIERMAKERPDECFLKGSGILKLTGAIRELERQNAELRQQLAASADRTTAKSGSSEERAYIHAALNRHYPRASIDQRQAFEAGWVECRAELEKRAAASAAPQPQAAQEDSRDAARWRYVTEVLGMCFKPSNERTKQSIEETNETVDAEIAALAQAGKEQSK
jgi:hypothetical protein